MLSASKSSSGLATGYNLTRSLRTRASASAYLNRTPSVAGNRQTWTYSVWAKLGAAVGTSNYNILMARTSATYYTGIYFNTNNLYLDWYNSSQIALVRSSQVFRDPSAWYHIVIAVNTTSATSSNRILMYVNGTQVTAFTTATYPPQNAQTAGINEASIATWISSDPAYPAQGYYDGYLAEVNFIDGQALTPSSFGSTSATTGVWQPAKYTGSYGTNGFYLPFTDNSALTTSSNVGLGKDFSGNGNYWTTNNISLTSGVTYDSMTDVPTLTSATAANFCVMNPAAAGVTSLVNGNLQFNNLVTYSAQGTIGVTSGQWYFECTVSTQSTGEQIVGVVNQTWGNTIGVGADINSWGIITQNNANNGQAYHNNTVTSSYATFASGDVVMVAFDVSAGKLWFGRNGTWFNSGAPASGTGFIYSDLAGTIFPALDNKNASTGVLNANFGQRPFTYTPPTGYVALNTYNLPTSTIVKGNTVMDATLYTGTGASLSVTNTASFKPDLVWVKGRSGATDHAWYDSVRGVQKQLKSNTTTAETTETTGLTAFGSAGFTVGALAQMNTSAATYVGWQWQAGQGSSSSNTSGSITSTVSVNASAGFSVVTFTTSAIYTGGTVGHGLGVAPAMYIVKNRNGSSNINWNTYHQSVGNTAALYLNSTSASVTSSTFWNNTSPTSSVFSVGANLYTSSDMVAYCWTPIAGFSAFGSYTGNGLADGPFVYTGFRPKFLLIKSTSVSGNWWMYDTSRSTYNAAILYLFADSSAAEVSDVTEPIDFLSNGFKLRIPTYQPNTSGGTFIYMAYAENPFKNSLAR